MQLLILGIVVAALVALLVVGVAAQTLGDSFRDLGEAKRKRREREQAQPRPPEPRFDPRRYTPERTRLRWFSPEIVAVLLLALAAGLWLARLMR